MENDEKYAEYLKAQTEQYLSFESLSPQWKEGQRRYIAEVLSDLPKDTRILDCACGDGVGLQVFRSLGFKNVVGVELSEVKAAKASAWGYEVIVADFHDMPMLKDGSFDVVYSSHSLEHAYDPQKVLAEFHRVLKPGSKLYLVLPFPDKGPTDAHTASEYLQTRGSEPLHLIHRLMEHGFQPLSFSQSSFRESEIWITAEKS